MRVAKKKSKETRVPVSFGALRPLVEEDYPEYLEHDGKLYYRVWVRPRLIAYEVLYPLTKAVHGYWIVPVGILLNDFNACERYIETNEKNTKLEIICS